MHENKVSLEKERLEEVDENRNKRGNPQVCNGIHVRERVQTPHNGTHASMSFSCSASLVCLATAADNSVVDTAAEGVPTGEDTDDDEEGAAVAAADDDVAVAVDDAVDGVDDVDDDGDDAGSSDRTASNAFAILFFSFVDLQ